MEEQINDEIRCVNKLINKQGSIYLLFYPFNENIGNKNLYKFYLQHFLKILHIIKLNNGSTNLIRFSKNNIALIIKSKSDTINSDNIIHNNKDYFHIFLILILFKFGDNNLFHLINIDEIKSNEIKEFELIERLISFLLSKKLADKKDIKFLLSLINHKPQKRPTFDDIYKYIYNTIYKNINDKSDNEECVRETNFAFLKEEKKIIELNKKDYLNKYETNANNSQKWKFKKNPKKLINIIKNN